MGIGQRKQVQLVQMVAAKQPAGNWNEVEGIRYGVWAEVSRNGGGRSYEHGQTNADNTKTFKIRFRFDKHPNVNWKIVYEDKDWTISNRSALAEKRFYWEITATSKADV